MDGSFISDNDNVLDSHNSSVLSAQKLYGIQENEEYEDILDSDRQMQPEVASMTKGMVQP